MCDLQNQLCGWPVSTIPTAKPIMVASDCSGLDSVMFACQALGLRRRVRLVFCSDVDKNCRRLLRSMHAPHLMYKDIKDRDVNKVPGGLDVYSAGFPCQPFSSAGLGHGKADKQGRGTVFEHVIAYILAKKPRSFILENVRGLTSNTHRAVFDDLLKRLRRDHMYVVSWRVLNTCDFGIPQNRPRLFIVGLLKDKSKPEVFKWPVPGRIQPKPLSDFLCGGCTFAQLPREGTRLASVLQELLTKARTRGANITQTPFAFDLGARRPSIMQDRIPCLTRSGCGRGGAYITSAGRFLSLEEMLLLQGLPTKLAEVVPTLEISERQLAQMVGNAMSTNILQLLLTRIITALELHT